MLATGDYAVLTRDFDEFGLPAGDAGVVANASDGRVFGGEFRTFDIYLPTPGGL